MAHVEVPKDLAGIRTTFAFGMSGKQLILLCVAGGVALALTTFIRGTFGLSIFASFLIAGVPVLVPVSLICFYKKNGLTFLQTAEIVLRHKVRRKPIRFYAKNITERGN